MKKVYTIFNIADIDIHVPSRDFYARNTLIGEPITTPAMKVEGTLTMVPAPNTVFGTAREIAGGRMWTIHHEGCKADANFHGGKLPKQHAIVKCKCGQSVQITEALTFEDQL